MLQKWKLTKINFTKPHENIAYKGSNKANAEHHKAMCNRYFICYNTDMFLQSLESQTYFIMFKHGNHWKWSATYAHTLQWITLTLMKTEQTVSITLETQVSLTTHTFDICFLLFVTFNKQTKYFLGHNRDNINRMCCEHTLLVFLNKKNMSVYIMICKQPNQLCCKV